jgi:Zn finger protein HypA/HybF involved in hydrogenase expression
VHEASLCLSLLRLAEEARVREGARRIEALCVEVGALCGVAPEALCAAFPICAAHTSAQGAELRIVRTQGRDLVLRELVLVD